MNIETLTKQIEELTIRVQKIEDAKEATVNKSSVAVKSMSPSEFLLENKPTSEVHATFLLCYYAEHILKMSSFNTDDIEQLFRTSRVPVPKNLNDKINKNIIKGFITDAVDKKGDKKAWTLTMTGDQAFNNK